MTSEVLTDSVRFKRLVILSALVVAISLLSLVSFSSKADATTYPRCTISETVVMYPRSATIPSGYTGPATTTRNCWMNIQYVVNEAVSSLQYTLNACYGESLQVDGVFGNGTYNALKRTQSKIGVVADGVYGPQTRDAMSWRYSGGGLPAICYNP